MKMFSLRRLLFRLNGFQKVLQRGENQTAGLDSHLMTIANSSPTKSYSPLFFDEEVQLLLKKISNFNLDRIFRPRPMGEEIKPPVYKLLTNEELEEELGKARQKAEYLIQIPPLVNVTEDVFQILDSDTSLDGYDIHHSKHVFTDISFSETNYSLDEEAWCEWVNGNQCKIKLKFVESRAIVVREPNGFLRTATKDERFRMNQIYNPTPGREIEMPRMFLTEHLLDVIKRKEYEFILDRACAQFEPDDLMYHKVITLTYEAINYCRDFKLLHSTRHFGSLAFYLISHKNIDSMLDDNIQNNRIEDAFSLVKLYLRIHPECKTGKSSEGKNDLDVLKDFINFEASVPSILNKSLGDYLTREKNKNEVEMEIKEAHGV